MTMEGHVRLRSLVLAARQSRLGQATLQQLATRTADPNNGLSMQKSLVSSLITVLTINITQGVFSPLPCLHLPPP
jgi:hypothetical protein